MQGGCDLENETVLTVLANVTRRVGSLGAGCDGVEGLESVGVGENPAGSLSGSVWAWVWVCWLVLACWWLLVLVLVRCWKWLVLRRWWRWCRRQVGKSGRER